MAGTGMKTIYDGVTKSLNDMVKRGRNADAFLNRVIYPEYQNYQARRWMAAGPGWKALNPKYAMRKKSVYASAPGAGSKLLIATGRLVGSVIGRTSGIESLGSAQGFKEHRKVVGRSKLVVSTINEYAEHVDEIRDFSTFDAEFKKDLAKRFAKYMAGVKNG